MNEAVEPFRPETSHRRFTISAADALSAVFLPSNDAPSIRWHGTGLLWAHSSAVLSLICFGKPTLTIDDLVGPPLKCFDVR